MNKLDEIIAKFKEYTKTKCIEISITKGETIPFESSFGGTPYLPNGFEYPYADNYSDSNKKVPMVLLAQINFEEIPHLEGFPEKGILQIFINPTDDLCGADFDNPTDQNNYKIFYHSEIDKNPENQQKAPDIIETDDWYTPISTSLKLDFEIQDTFMGTGDYRFDETFLKFYNKETGENFDDIYNDFSDKDCDKIYEELSTLGHHMGGYPFFTQTDPRYDDEVLQKYSTLLLQIDSDMCDGEDLILWGDCGVCNFFIKPEDLKNCKFDDVVYNWDCY